MLQSHKPEGTREKSLAVQHADYMPLFDLGVVRARQVSTTAAYRHRNNWRIFHRMIFVRRGALAWPPQGVGGKRLLDANHGPCLLPAGSRAELMCIDGHSLAGDGSSHVFIQLMLDPNLIAIDGVYDTFGLDGNLAACALDALMHIDLRAERSGQRRHWADSACCHLRACLEQAGARRLRRASSAVSMLLSEVHDEPNRDWSLETLAEWLGCSPTHVGRRFTVEGLASPMREVRRIRLDRAAAYLAQTSLDLGTVARRSGFHSAPAMSRAFLQQFGVRPRDYRAGLAVSAEHS